MNTEDQTKTDYVCRYCEKSFRKESSLAVHLCEQKRRYQEEKETGVQIGLQSYLKFYEITQGSSKLKTFSDFAKSPYYRAFVKFGRYCVSIRAINITRFIEWLLRNNKKLDHWCRDSIYGEYLLEYLRVEHVNDALARALEESLNWAEKNSHPDKDYLRYGNTNTVTYAITTGRISPWVLYNCDSGNELLGNLNHEQIAMIWPMIDADFWSKKFRDYPADTEYARDMLSKAGW